MNDQTRQRLLNLEALVEAGFAPYPYRFPKTHSAEAILKAKRGAPPESEWPEEEVAVAGRLVALRRMGKVTFAHLLDETGRIQLYFQRDLTPKYELLKKLDVGDILGVSGHPFTTKTGEVTVKVLDWTPLVKSLHPLLCDQRLGVIGRQRLRSALDISLREAVHVDGCCYCCL